LHGNVKDQKMRFRALEQAVVQVPGGRKGDVVTQDFGG
jgi:hypothetical protein